MMPEFEKPDQGPISFSEVVERLAAERPSEPAEYRPSVAIGSGAAAQPLHEPAYVSQNALSQIYGSAEENFGPAKPRIRETPVAPPPSIEPRDVARELKLRMWHSADQIVAIRRLFAKKNHPDRVIPSHREAATTRMSIANMLVDEALRTRDERA